MTQTLQAGAASVTIDHHHGGRLASLAIAGHEILVGHDDGRDTPMGWGCFPMIPWAGRIRRGRFADAGRQVRLPLGLPPHAIHGTTFRRPWTDGGTGAGTATLACDLGEDWPWPGRATQTVELAPTHLSLTITVEASPGAGSAMPVTAGWHPWFRRRIDGIDVALTLPAERMWRRDDEGIPDGTLVEPPPGPWDDCFTALVGPVELHWPGVLRLYVESDCEHVVVYDEQEDAVCVEPQSAPPDAHNSGEDLVHLAPGDSWSITSMWVWEVPGTGAHT